MKLYKYFFLLLLSFSCGGGGGGGSGSDKDIVSFTIDGTEGLIVENNITVPMPGGTSLTSLAPVIVVSEGASVLPVSEESQDFSEPVEYVVTASDGTTKTYTVTVYAYSLRDTGPAGGLIFYINPDYLSDGWCYLEANPNNINDEIAWSNVINTLVGTETEIGTGAANTAAIIAQNGHTQSMAKLCVDATTGGKTDWFLPSKDELNKMYINLHSGTDENDDVFVPVGSFIDFYYLSSSEYSATIFWDQQFGNGSQANEETKDYEGDYARCARYF